MAQMIHCDTCHEEIGAFLITSLADGEVMAVGASCAPQVLRGMALALEPEPEGETVEHPAPDELSVPADDPTAPAETGPGTYEEAGQGSPSPFPDDDPRTPAETGPGTPEEEGGQVPPVEPGPSDEPSDVPDPGATPGAPGAPGESATPLADGDADQPSSQNVDGAVLARVGAG